MSAHMLANMRMPPRSTGVPRPGAAQLTFDHYPSVTCERERIEAAGGRVSATNDVQLGEIGEILVRRGDTNLPGLGISRSIGDSAAKEVTLMHAPIPQFQRQFHSSSANQMRIKRRVMPIRAGQGQTIPQS